MRGHHETVTSALLAAGADVLDRGIGGLTVVGTTPLHLAAENGHQETVSALLAADADVNVLDRQQTTPLHLAAREDHPETVSALLAAGADVNAQDWRQWTSLHLAAENGHHETVSALLTAGADVNVQDCVGRNPLHYATEREHSKCVEVLLEHGAVKDIKKDPEFVDLEQMLDTILSRLDETGVRLLMRVWSARTGKRESPGAGVPADLIKDMMKSEYITTGDLVQLEKDMIAAGISFPAVVRDIPGVPDELKYTRTVESAVGPMDGELEIPGFVKLIVPPGVLQQDTLITISTVDVAAILRDPESLNWTSGYPWSLGEDTCPRELLDQVLFSPAVDVNLHGAQLTGDLEMQTWRPPGSEGMECLVLKHHDGEGWTDITASTEHQIYLDKISISVHSFSPVAFVWAPVEAIISVGKTMISALSSRTLNCRFAAHIKPLANDVQFHVVCRDQRVETDEYLPGFTWCGSNAAMFDLFHGDVLDIAVNVHGGQDNISEHMVLNSKQCCDKNGQNVQIMLDRPNRNCVKGNVHVKKVQGTSNRIACQFIFKEEGDTYQRDYKRDNTTEEADSTRTIPTEQVESVRQNLAATGITVTEGDRKKEETSRPHAGPGDIRTDSIVRGSGSKPVVLLINDEYSNSHGGVSTIHRQMANFLASKGAAVVHSIVLGATEDDKDEAAADGVQLIFPTMFKGDERKPILDWLTWDHQTRYPSLPSDVGFIVGHVNITSRAARQIKEQRFSDAKLVQVTHEIPEETSHYQGDEKVMTIGEESDIILDDLQHADVIFSVGPLVYDYYQTKQLKCQHYEFLPKPSDMFSEMQVNYVHTKTKTVLSMGMIMGAESLRGYDIAAKAMHIVIEQLPNTKWRAYGVSPEDFPESKKIIQANVEKGKIHFTPLKNTTQEELSRHMQQAHVVLMPSRAEPFGLVGLEAIAAGVPVLVSDRSGLAWFLKSQDPEFDRLIVEISDDDEEATKTLAKRIIKILKDGDREFQAARRLKEKLLASKYWEDSHSKFLEAFGL
ncbi:ANK1 [Branchiostoma lanceolatum]|nr:ANK1 [Branchiostoma lanceolatum]